MNQSNKKYSLDQTIMELVQEKKPTTVKKLVSLTKSETMFVSEQEIMQHVLQLQKQGKLKLRGPKTSTPKKFGVYLRSTDASWYWMTIILAISAALTIFAIPQDFPPLTYVRNILGALFILFLPGYSLIKLLFPKKDLNLIERTALSIGMSLALVPMIGLILYYTPLGIQIAPTALSILAITIIFATVAIIREHQYKATKKEDKTSTT